MALSKLAYDRAGSGEPVVLIHGIGHRRQAWDPIFHRLAERDDVIAVDLADFGESLGGAICLELGARGLASSVAC